MIGLDTVVVAALISSLFGPILVNIVETEIDYWKAIKAKRSTSTTIVIDPLEDAINNSEVVNNYLSNINKDFEFDRAWVSMFHNGGHYYPTGKSIQKFSIFYEVAKPGIAPIQLQFKNTPVSLLSTAIGEVYKKGRLLVDIEDLDIFGLESAMISTGTKSAFLFALKNLENKFFGVVGFDVVNESRKLTDEELEILQAQVNTLSGYIFEYLHSKGK